MPPTCRAADAVDLCAFEFGLPRGGPFLWTGKIRAGCALWAIPKGLAMPLVISIRAAEAKDLAAVKLCAEEAYQQYVAAIGRKPAPMIADFGSLIAAGRVYVAVDETANLAGFIVFYAQGAHVLLENVAVRKNATGRGIGKRLIGFCEQEAARKGAVSVRLYTNEKMVENLRIYPHLGYLETGRRCEDGFDRVYFEKRL